MSGGAIPRLEPGRPETLGAVCCDDGVRFAVFSQRAESIELCVFDDSGTRELQRHRLHGPDDGIFHGLLRGAKPGLRYGYRAHGAYKPEHGRRFNAHKILLDPYARAIAGRFDWQDPHQGCLSDHPEGDRFPDPCDNAGTALKGIVLPDPGPAPGLGNRPRTPVAESEIGRAHV